MCLKVLTKHKPYCITGLVKEETIYKTKYVQKWKKSLYLVHFKNNPNTHFGNVQKPPKRRLEEKRTTVCMLNYDYRDREPDGDYIKHVACRGFS